MSDSVLPFVFVSGLCLHAHAAAVTADKDGDNQVSWQESQQFLRPCEATIESSLSWYDKAHLQLSDSVCDQAVWFDNFFSPDPLNSEIATSLVKVKLRQRWHEKKGLRAEPKISAYLNLPNTKRRLKLYIESQFSRLDGDSIDNEPLLSPSDEKGTAAAVRWFPWERQAWDLALDAGARFDGGPDPFTRVIARFSYPMGTHSVAKLSQELLVELQDSWSETSRFSIDHYKGQQGYRWYNRAKYGDQTNGLEWDVYLGTVTQLDERSTLSFYVELQGATDDPLGTHSENRKLGLHYRHSFFRPWLFYELEPQLTWPREYGYNFTPVFLFNLEIQLGRKK